MPSSHIQSWIKQIKFHLKKIHQLSHHIFFLSSCLKAGIPPNGLTIKFPTTGLIPSPHLLDAVNLLRYTTSMTLTQTVLHHYTILKEQHFSKLLSFVKLLHLSHPNADSILTPILSRFSSPFPSQPTLSKLSNLYISHLHNKSPLPSPAVNSLPKKLPLIADKPSLQYLFNLPPPLPGPPKLPPRQPPPKPVPPPSETSTCPPSSVTNLSSRPLSPSESSVLSKGLSFCPTPKFNHFKLVADALHFGRSLRWKYFWSQNPNHNPTPSKLHPSLKKFSPPSSCEPPPLSSSHPLEVYITSILSKVSDPSFPEALNHTHNLSRPEQLALRTLRSDPSIVILPADKGSNTVVLDTEAYTSEAIRQLSDRSCYLPLSSDPTLNFHSTISNFLSTRGPTEGLSPSDIEILLPRSPRTPHFYLLPKIHKEGCPGRPIVASFGSPTERISAFVDSFLQPHVQDLPSYTRDTSHFLQVLRNFPTPLPDHLLLVTVDVTSLYTNIPNPDGLAAVKHFLNTRPHPHIPSTSFLLQLCEFVLEMNNFRFEESHYLQIKGTAMGTRMAPSYANLTMGHLEDQFLKSQPLQPLMWRRYIDDIFFLWPHGVSSLNTFLSNLNSYSSLSFTHSFSDTHITFLDVDIRLQSGKLDTGVHIKPTNSMQYLHFQSCHSHSQKRSIPYSLGIRGHRICSDSGFLDKYITSLRTALLSRGYPSSLVNKQIRASSHSHPTPPNPESFHLFTTFHPGLHILNKYLKEFFVILSSNPSTSQFLSKPPTVTFQRPSNLRNLLVKTNPDLKPPSLPTGTHPCNRPRCKTCNLLVPSSDFTSPSTHKTYPITSSSTCMSSNVVYCLECRQCNSFYVGETGTPFSIRINGHRSSVNCNRDVPISEHARSHPNLPFNDLFQARILKQLPADTPDSVRKRWEQSYQLILKSKTSPGLNKQ